MSKRYSKSLTTKVTYKRPKLDELRTTTNITTNITIRNGGSGGSQFSVLSIPDNPLNGNSANLWGDDEDDDIIFFASQRIEEAAGVPGQNNVDINVSEVNFDRFSREVNASTQNEKADKPLDHFKDGDEIFKNLPENFDHDVPGPSTRAPAVIPGSTFKCPNAPDANSREVVYLQKQVQTLRKENERLKKENSKGLENRQQLDMEATALRKELEQGQRTRNYLMPSRSVDEREKVNKELARTVENQKKMIAGLEKESAMKSAFESFNMHPLQEAMPEHYALNIPPMSLLERPFSNEKTSSIFCLNPKARPTDHDKILTGYTIELQNITMEAENCCDDGRRYELQKNLQCIAIKGVLHMQKYSLTFKFTEYTDFEYFAETDGYLEKNNLFQIEKLFPSEISPAGRQFLTTVAAACSSLPLLDYLLEEIPIVGANNDSFLGILLKLIYNIGYTANVADHSALIYSSTILFESLVDHIEAKQEHLTFANEFFKGIIHTRPGVNGLRPLVRILLKISSKEMASKFLHLLCHSSTKKAFKFNEAYKIYQFTEESCVLQILCALMEATCHEENDWTKQNDWLAMVELTLNTIKFFTNYFADHMPWMKEHTERQCSCYKKIGSCIVILLHFCLNHWMMGDKVMSTEIADIAKGGILLLSSIFSNSSSSKNVLQKGGFHVKNRLQNIYNIITYNHKLFNFSSTHRNATEALKLHLIIFDPLCSSETQDTPIDAQYLSNDEARKIFF